MLCSKRQKRPSKTAAVSGEVKVICSKAAGEVRRGERVREKQGGKEGRNETKEIS